MNKKLVYGAIAITFIVAVLALFSVNPTNNGKGLGVATPTTFLPSFGLGTLIVGSGCDQQYTPCIPSFAVDATTTTMGSTTQAMPIIQGAQLATTSNGTSVFAPDDLIDYSTIVVLPLTSTGATINFPASTTVATSTGKAFLPLPGMYKHIDIINSTTTATAPITLGAGTGILISDATTTKILRTGARAGLDCTRYALGTTTSNAAGSPVGTTPGDIYCLLNIGN